LPIKSTQPIPFSTIPMTSLPAALPRLDCLEES
jgi:hypothetical protein